jgi:hypothetical protein
LNKRSEEIYFNVIKCEKEGVIHAAPRIVQPREAAWLACAVGGPGCKDLAQESESAGAFENAAMNSIYNFVTTGY